MQRGALVAARWLFLSVGVVRPAVTGAPCLNGPCQPAITCSQEFVMGQGLIPADGEVWRARRRVVAPALHKKYVLSMLELFNRSARHGCRTLDKVRCTRPRRE